LVVDCFFPLFTNASHAMEAQGGQLSVRAENVALKEEILPGVGNPIAPGSYLRLTVSDTGMGIADEIKERIFDPYFTTKETGKGTGMGLCMVQGIMKNSGGGIVLDTQPGAGTSFALYFPLVDMPASTVARTDTTIPCGSEHILFVDDEALIVDLSAKMLKRLGYRVTSCTDAFHALSLIEADSSAFDLIITDMTIRPL
jgi:CheY-like chemotaxis protein